MPTAAGEKQPEKRPRPGAGKDGAASRRIAFINRFMSNGHNASEAAIAAGFSPRTAASQGQRLLKHVEISGQLAEMARRASSVSGLTVERTLLELARVAYADPRTYFNDDGTMIPITELSDDQAAAVASVESDEHGRPTKIKFWDKNAALEKALKHLGLYERNNVQRSDNLALQVVLVQPKPRPPEDDD